VNLAPLYFLAFMVFGSMVMLNLFIAVVIVSGGHAWSGLYMVSECCMCTFCESVWGTYTLDAGVGLLGM
jgi:hypothetical protein